MEWLSNVRISSESFSLVLLRLIAASLPLPRVRPDWPWPRFSTPSACSPGATGTLRLKASASKWLRQDPAQDNQRTSAMPRNRGKGRAATRQERGR